MAVVAPDLPRSVPCPIAFVAEAPAEEEENQGRPLVGPSGRVFNQLLQIAKVDRGACLVTNLFNERAPDNDIKAFTVPAAQGAPDLPRFGDRAFEPTRVRAALSRLAAEIEAADPAVIVPLGNAALWAFTGLSTITQTRGAPMKATMTAPGRLVVPTFHPAYVLRQWKMFHVVAGDIQRAAGLVGLKAKAHGPDRHLWVSPTLVDLKNFWRLHLERAPLIACDIETAARQITTVGFASGPLTAISVPFVAWHRPGRSYWPTPEAEVAAWTWVRAVLDSPIPKVFQNGLYDVWYLWRVMGIKPRAYTEDTMLLHHALYAELPKSLGFMGASYTTEGPWKLLLGTHRSNKDGKRND